MKKYMAGLAVVLFLALSGCGGSGGGDVPAKANMTKETLQYDGDERSYYLLVPNSVKASSKKVPLVIVLHGGGGNGENAARMTGFSDKAREEGFIVVYPNGTPPLDALDTLMTWNAVHCCGTAMEENIDDVGFISSLIDTLAANYPVDTGEVFVTGMSNGGMMTHCIGRELYGKVTAIAPVVSGLFGDEVLPKKGVPAIIINGEIDESIPLEGGDPGGRFPDAWDGTSLKPVLYQAEFWAQANGCSLTPTATKTPVDDAVIMKLDYTPCPNEKKVHFYTVSDNGHAWPGGEKGSEEGDIPSDAMNATDEIWKFFSNFVD